MLDPHLLEFVASVFASTTGLLAACAWPFALLIVVLFLRKPILAAIPNLTRFKAGSLEFEFGERLEELERKADDAQIPPSAEGPEDVVGPEFGRLYSLAELNPRSAILEAWLLVETAITDAAAQFGVEPSGTLSRSPFALLKRIRTFSPRLEDLIPIVDSLRQLRNSAVHDAEFSLGLEETVEYIDLAIRVSTAVHNLPQDGL